MREESLLTQVRLLTEKHEALAAANGLGFSLFSILDRETDEVQTHSAILCELLNPAGTHQQGAVFLRAFARRFHLDDAQVEAARIWREATIAKGSRADILVEVGETMVVIENKIHAGDRPAQLERYHAYADQWPKPEVFYLTLWDKQGGKRNLELVPKIADAMTELSIEAEWTKFYGCL